MIALDLTGQRFGRLIALRRAGFIVHGKNRRIAWLCECDCGKRITVSSMVLRTKNTKSCGCLSREASARNIALYDGTKHGHARRDAVTKTYRSWNGMIERCRNPNNRRFKYYGGRGIKVCKRWLNSFENFYADMGDRPEGHTLDRKNNDGNYTPKNCRWATIAEQAAGQRHNRGPNRKSS
jgi:hypothetical protein